MARDRSPVRSSAPLTRFRDARSLTGVPSAKSGGSPANPDKRAERHRRADAGGPWMPHASPVVPTSGLVLAMLRACGLDARSAAAMPTLVFLNAVSSNASSAPASRDRNGLVVGDRMADLIGRSPSRARLCAREPRRLARRLRMCR